MDFQHRPGGKTGSGGVASASESNRDRRERLRQLALETIDINKVSLGLCVLGKSRTCCASPASCLWISSGLCFSEGLEGKRFGGELWIGANTSVSVNVGFKQETFVEGLTREKPALTYSGSCCHVISVCSGLVRILLFLDCGWVCCYQ